MPVIAFACDTCGYVECCAAQKTVLGNKVEPSVLGASLLRSAQFERQVLDAILGSDSPFPGFEVRADVNEFTDPRGALPDIVVTTKGLVAFLEVKSASSERVVASGADYVRRLADSYSKRLTGETRPAVVRARRGARWPGSERGTRPEVRSQGEEVPEQGTSRRSSSP